LLKLMRKRAGTKRRMQAQTPGRDGSRSVFRDLIVVCARRAGPPMRLRLPDGDDPEPSGLLVLAGQSVGEPLSAGARAEVFRPVSTPCTTCDVAVGCIRGKLTRGEGSVRRAIFDTLVIWLRRKYFWPAPSPTCCGRGVDLYWCHPRMKGPAASPRPVSLRLCVR
jgi:hypothetical protein